MNKYKIAWLPGDGVGPELAELAKLVLSNLDFHADLICGDIGWEFWKNEGNPLPKRTLEILKNTDCAFLGAITSKPIADAERELKSDLLKNGFEYSSPIIELRQKFQLYTNLRPCKEFKDAKNNKNNIDLVIFRENTEGLYSGIEFHPMPKKVFDILSLYHEKMNKYDPKGLDDIALSLRVVTRPACQKILRRAFNYARINNRGSVTLVDKPNVLRKTGAIMRDEALLIAKEYPEIIFQEVNIDAMCMYLIKNANEFSVIVAENMFGDILSDLAAQLTGGLGFAGSANIGENYAVFEPAHGSVPKYAGQNKVNPIATFLSIKMMLDWLGETEKGLRLEYAIQTLISERKYGTYDMGMKNSNLELTNQICRIISS